MRPHDHAAPADHRHRADCHRRPPAPKAPTTQACDCQIGGHRRPRHRRLLYREVSAAPVAFEQPRRKGRFRRAFPNVGWVDRARIESMMRFRLTLALALLASTSPALQADLTGQARSLSTVAHPRWRAD